MPATAARRRRAPWVIAIVAAVVVLVAAGAVGWAQLQQPAAPAQTATRFWQLLADGKAEEALALTDTPAGSVPNGLLLTDAVYGKADRGIAHVEAGSFRRAGDQASGTITYSQHGTQRTSRVELALVHRGLLAKPTWQITNAPIAKVDVTVASGGHADKLSVDGRSLPLPGGDGKLAIPALPGTYTFAAGDSTGLFSPVPKQVAVAGANAAVTLGVAPSSALGTQAVAQATKLVNGCFASHTLSGCPLADGIRNIFNLTAEPSVSYALTRQPALAFDAKAMQVKSTRDGQITTTQTDTRNGTFSNTADFSVALDVTVSGGKVALAPHDGGVASSGMICVPGARSAAC
ncbi:hypothetical protein GCM10022286_21920 [Gryllotalpicola daejeonensis]|uniref:Uncharacterized protein n=1 Tax=Gryllotalpicola daejeonensis TaxID=993087 RepID=A0ABP7ZL67_9MICO